MCLTKGQSIKNVIGAVLNRLVGMGLNEPLSSMPSVAKEVPHYLIGGYNGEDVHRKTWLHYIIYRLPEV